MKTRKATISMLKRGKYITNLYTYIPFGESNNE